MGSGNCCFELSVDPNIEIWKLSVGERQRVEIIKALYRDAELLVLDEPTAVLTPQEVDDLFVILRRMTAQGTGIVFISRREAMDALKLSSRSRSSRPASPRAADDEEEDEPAEDASAPQPRKRHRGR